MKQYHYVAYPDAISSFTYEVLSYIFIIPQHGISERVYRTDESLMLLKSRNFQKMNQSHSSVAIGRAFWHIGHGAYIGTLGLMEWK